MGPDAKNRRSAVVITGVGLVTPLGTSAAATWNAMLRAHSGIDLWQGTEIAGADVAMPALPIGRVHIDPEVADVAPIMRRRRLSRAATLGLLAAREAWQDAGLPDSPPSPQRLAVAVSAAMGDVEVFVDGWERFKTKGWSRVPPFSVPMHMANAPAVALALEYQARGGMHALVSACTSGTQAIATGIDLIRRGDVDVVIAGGADSPLHPLTLAGFDAMHALSHGTDPTTACRPFDSSRDGMVLAEGAGIMILESAEHAARRHARVYADVVGVGMASDAHHVVLPEPTGASSAAAIRAALADARIGPEDVSQVNANGTSTVVGDVAEGRALADVFGNGQVMVTANKSMLGHSLGGAGAIEAIVTVLSLRHGRVPPTRNLDELDRRLALDVVHGTSRELPAGRAVAVKNSSGFGGLNVALAFATDATGGAAAEAG